MLTALQTPQVDPAFSKSITSVLSGFTLQLVLPQLLDSIQTQVRAKTNASGGLDNEVQSWFRDTKHQPIMLFTAHGQGFDFWCSIVQWSAFQYLRFLLCIPSPYSFLTMQYSAITFFAYAFSHSLIYSHIDDCLALLCLSKQLLVTLMATSLKWKLLCACTF